MTAPSSRVVRVFISSTFRDFGAERDLLMKRVFPELRRRARARFVEVIGVDLRWGITEEESERGETLPICLREIERSRPYFVCLLGERYGWTPVAGQYPELLLEQQPWLREHAGGKSVTELEILHGVLNAPEMAGRAYFYLRDPTFSEGKGADYASEDEDARGKLARLKERIRGSAFPVAGFATPEEVADRITDDLWRLIDAEYPEDEVPDELERERRLHEVFAAEKRRCFVGREKELATIARVLAGMPDESGVVRTMLEINGDSGKGKSALLAVALQKHCAKYPHDLVFAHYLSASPEACHMRSILDGLEAFVRKAEQSDGRSSPRRNATHSDARVVQDLVVRAAVVAEARGGRFILAIDGLDRLDAKKAEWLPVRQLSGASIVATTSEYNGWTGEEGLNLWTLSASETQDLIKAILASQGRKLSAHHLSRFDREVEPLHAVFIAADLAMVSRFEELPSRVERVAATEETDSMVELLLTRLEVDFGAEAIATVFGALWVLESGLRGQELRDLACLSPLDWARLELSISEVLSHSGDYLRLDAEDAVVAVRRRYIADSLPTAIRTDLLKWMDVRSGADADVAIDSDTIEIELDPKFMSDWFLHGCLLEVKVGSVLAMALAPNNTHDHRVMALQGDDGWIWVTHLRSLGNSADMESLVVRLRDCPAVKRFRGSWHRWENRKPTRKSEAISRGLLEWSDRLADRRTRASVIRGASVHLEDRECVTAAARSLLAAIAVSPLPGDGLLIDGLVDLVKMPNSDVGALLNPILDARSESWAALSARDRVNIVQALQRREVDATHAARLVFFDALQVDLWNVELPFEDRIAIIDTLLDQADRLCARADHPREKECWRFRGITLKRLKAGILRDCSQGAETEAFILDWECSRALAEADGKSRAEIALISEQAIRTAVMGSANAHAERELREAVADQHRFDERFDPIEIAANGTRLLELLRESNLVSIRVTTTIAGSVGALCRLGRVDEARALLDKIEHDVRVPLQELGMVRPVYMRFLDSAFYPSHSAAYHQGGLRVLASFHFEIGSFRDAHRLAAEVLGEQRRVEADPYPSSDVLLSRDDLWKAQKIEACSAVKLSPCIEAVERLTDLSEHAMSDTVDWEFRCALIDAAIDGWNVLCDHRRAFGLELRRVALLERWKPESPELGRRYIELADHAVVAGATLTEVKRYFLRGAEILRASYPNNPQLHRDLKNAETMMRPWIWFRRGGAQLTWASYSVAVSTCFFEVLPLFGAVVLCLLLVSVVEAVRRWRTGYLLYALVLAALVPLLFGAWWTTAIAVLALTAIGCLICVVSAPFVGSRSSES